MCQIVMVLMIILPGCAPDPTDKPSGLAYYFPIDELPEGGMKYVYTNKSQPEMDNEVWIFEKSGEGRLKSTNLNFDGVPVLVQYDHVQRTGVTIDSLILVFEDTAGMTQQLPVTILEARRFPGDELDTSKTLTTLMDWHQPGDSLHVVLKRSRSFAGDTTFRWQGKSVPAVKFVTHDVFETEEVGWTTSTWEGEEWYALGLGLVYYRRNISDQMILEFELSAIMKNSDSPR